MRGPCEKSLPTAVELLAGFSVSESDTAVARETGARANSSRFKWLDHRNSVFVKCGVPLAQPYQDRARVAFSNGRMGGTRFAADTPVGIAGGRGEFSAPLMDTDAPAYLCWAALDSLGGELDFFVILRPSSDWGSSVGNMGGPLWEMGRPKLFSVFRGT